MIRLEQLKIRIDVTKRREPWDWEESVRTRAAAALGISPGDIADIRLVRHSIDARKKPELYDVCTVELDLNEADEKRVLRLKTHKVAAVEPAAERIHSTHGERKLMGRPVVVGAGPAGLFAALTLARAGFSPVLIERGDDTEGRDRAVRTFLEGGILDPESNVQFGAGGAGAYSDGKLTTGVKDRDGTLNLVMRTFADMGAPYDILYEAHPHVGTDVLKLVVKNIVNEIRASGGEVRFRTRLDRFLKNLNGGVRGAETNRGDIEANAVILATGHSARDTLNTLLGQGVSMVPKAFAVGFRVAHPQALIDKAQYGIPSGDALPPAIYKLVGNRGKRPVYSFCMCPGGVIINASSENGGLAVNGMSERARRAKYANSAIVAAVMPDDYMVSGTVTDGISFQRRLEERAFNAGGGMIPWSDYRMLRHTLGMETPRFSGETAASSADREIFAGLSREADISGIMDRGITLAITDAIEEFGRRIKGFDDGCTVLAGIESRTSSPVRIERREDGQAYGLDGLYPCGEGAGYAGGIVSAAMDGVRVAEKVIKQFAPPKVGYT